MKCSLLAPSNSLCELRIKTFFLLVSYKYAHLSYCEISVAKFCHFSFTNRQMFRASIST